MTDFMGLIAALLIIFSPTNIQTNSNSDVALMEEMVLREAAFESFVGKIAVAATAMNRVENHMWPNTVKGVVLQPDQFTGMWVEPAPSVRQPTRDDARLASALAMHHGVRPCGRDVYWYHANYISTPGWVSRLNLEVACKIGLHIFYRRAREN